MTDLTGQLADPDANPPTAPPRAARPSAGGRKRYRPLVENFIERSPVTTLLVVSLLCVLILLVVMALVINGWSFQRLPVINAEKEPYSALGSLFQGLIGSSFALAGSIVAIYLAILGLRVVREQERREQEQYIRTYLAEALLPIKRVARSISELTFAYLDLHISPGEWRERMTDDAAGTLIMGKSDAFVRAVNSLAADLEAVCLSPQALHLWGCSNSEPKNYLPKLWRTSGNLTPCPNATSDPIRYAAYLKAGAARFKLNCEEGRPAEAWLNREKLTRGFIRFVQEKNGAKLDFDEIEFTGLGVSLWLRAEKEAAYNYGLATLLDIDDAIPDGAELRRFTEQEFDVDLGDGAGNLFASRLSRFIRNNEPAQLAEPRLSRILERWGGDVERLYLVRRLAQAEDAGRGGG